MFGPQSTRSLRLIHRQWGSQWMFFGRNDAINPKLKEINLTTVCRNRELFRLQNRVWLRPTSKKSHWGENSLGQRLGVGCRKCVAELEILDALCTLFGSGHYRWKRAGHAGIQYPPRLRRQNYMGELLSWDGQGHGGGVLLPPPAPLGYRSVLHPWALGGFAEMKARAWSGCSAVLIVLH